MSLIVKMMFTLILINGLVGCGNTENAFSESLGDDESSVSSLAEIASDEVFIDSGEVESLSDEEILAAVSDKVELKISDLNAETTEEEVEAEKTARHIAKLTDFLEKLESSSELQDKVIARVREGKPFLKRKRKPKMDQSVSGSEEVVQSDSEDTQSKPPKRHGHRMNNLMELDLDSFCEKVESRLDDSLADDQAKLNRLQNIYDEKCVASEV